MGFWIAGGIVGLLAVLGAARIFMNANPGTIMRIGLWVSVITLVALGVTLVAYRSVMLGTAAWSLAAFLAVQALRSRGGAGVATGGLASDVETEWLRMSLDIQTGATTGTILKGRFAGSRIETLPLEDLWALLAEARVNDPDAAHLIEAYIARVHPYADPAPEGAAATAGPMSRAEALDVLGLQEGATLEDVRQAHRRLMQNLHPDKGGSDYLASKINEARDFLLAKP